MLSIVMIAHLSRAHSSPKMYMCASSIMLCRTVPVLMGMCRNTHLVLECEYHCQYMNGYFLTFDIVPAQCPTTSTVSGCSTCCCASSDNVEFYVPNQGEPNCTAPDAVYEVKFVATWTATCHPDYYFDNAHWSPLTGISHKPEYELWDACMYDVSPGVAIVSQTGATSKWVCHIYVFHS